VLERPHGAFAQPDYGARRLTTVAARRPITGIRTVLPVLGQRTARDGRVWQQVLLPGRPNGASGWIVSRFTRYSETTQRLHVDLSDRRVTVVRDGRVVRTFGAIVGAPATPTPRGRFFVEENVALAAGLSGAPYALALSARSEVLQEFDGGPGQIALHGRGGVGGVIGSAVSHGCIRLESRAIGWLALNVAAGTTVTVSA
jgi:lipoprotein-anchoring transpeptidase ErfK/SrfK